MRSRGGKRERSTFVAPRPRGSRSPRKRPLSSAQGPAAPPTDTRGEREDRDPGSRETPIGPQASVEPVAQGPGARGRHPRGVAPRSLAEASGAARRAGRRRDRVGPVVSGAATPRETAHEVGRAPDAARPRSARGH